MECSVCDGHSTNPSEACRVEPMKVMVTGASGFLGRYVVASLLRSGFNVVAVSRERRVDGVEFIPWDLLQRGDPRGLVVAAGATHLIHLAWYTEHDRYWSS